MWFNSLVAKEQKGNKTTFLKQWNARWRRKNYDLHNVLGFYTTWIAIILAVTGSFGDFNGSLKDYKLAGGEKSLIYIEPKSDSTIAVKSNIPAIDRYI